MSVTYYFTGDCSEESVKDEIRKKFITTLSTSSYKDACLVYAKECNVDNVQVCTLVFVCLFDWGLSSHSRSFHPYGDVTF